jgi:GAF domain-containing protein
MISLMQRSQLMDKLQELRTRQQKVDNAWKETGNKQFLQFIIDILPRTLNAERASIFILDPADNSVWLSVGTGMAEREITVPKGSSLVGRTISTGQCQIETDMENTVGAHDVVAVKTGFITRNAICVPVYGVTTDKITGAIQVLNKRGGQEFDDEDRDILEKLAFHIQVNIENLFLKQELLRVSELMKETIAKLETKLAEHNTGE